MKKKISVLLTLALLLSAASCAADNAPGTSAAQTTTTAAENTTTSAASAETAAAPAETTAAVTKKVIPEDAPYVIENGITDRMKALANYIDGNKARLAKVFRKAQAGEPITVAYLGGSITQGSSAQTNKWYAKLVTEWLQEQFPDSQITDINAGIGATGSYIGVYRADRDVISRSPDLVFIDFSVNDTTEHTDRNMASYDGLIQKLWNSDSSPAIVTIAMTMENGTSFQEYHGEICEAYDIPMISYHDAIMDVIRNKHIVWKDISDDNIHPNTVGHSVLTEIICSYLQSVIDDLDSIDTEHESDVSKPYITDKYNTAGLILPGSDEVTDSTGWKLAANNFGNFGDCYRAVAKEGTFEGVSPLVFEFDAKSIGVFYGEIVGGGATFDVEVDGQVVKTIDSEFPGGWGSYVEAEEIIDFDECGHHTVRIIPHDSDTPVLAVISALAITK